MWTSLQPEILIRMPDGMRNGVLHPANLDDTPPPRSAAQGWKKCIDSLLDIRLLEHDWDGQDTPAPTVEVVDSAIILAVLLRQHHVVPPAVTVQSVTGSVLMEWQWADQTTFEIDVLEPGVADLFLMVPGQAVKYWQIKECVAHFAGVTP